MRVLVCGSRDWTDRKAIERRLLNLPLDSTVVHGGARGADRLAGAVATELGLNVEVYEADWNRYGKSAGYMRNAEMIESRPDLVIAFWDGVSAGTANTIKLAKRSRIETEIYKD